MYDLTSPYIYFMWSLFYLYIVTNFVLTNKAIERHHMESDELFSFKQIVKHILLGLPLALYNKFKNREK